LIDRLEALRRRHRQIQEEMGRPEVVSDHQKLASLGRELRGLEPLIAAYERYLTAREQLTDAREMLRSEKDPQMQEFLRGEEKSAEQRMADIEEELKVLLLPKDPNDERDVVVEIQGAEGGQEAALFAADLFRMYQRWVETKRWKVEMIELQESGIGGFDKVSFEVHGQGAYSEL
jgi:peptide chain release factor 1